MVLSIVKYWTKHQEKLLKIVWVIYGSILNNLDRSKLANGGPEGVLNLPFSKAQEALDMNLTQKFSTGVNGLISGKVGIMIPSNLQDVMMEKMSCRAGGRVFFINEDEWSLFKQEAMLVLTLWFNIPFCEFMDSAIKQMGKLICEELIERSLRFL